MNDASVARERTGDNAVRGSKRARVRFGSFGSFGRFASFSRVESIRFDRVGFQLSIDRPGSDERSHRRTRAIEADDARANERGDARVNERDAEDDARVDAKR